MATGTIKTKTDKNFGFIKMEGSDDVFFHASVCNGQFDALSIGQTVQFDLEQGEKGPKAVNVVAAAGGADEAPMDMAA
jgi:cold shock protein